MASCNEFKETVKKLQDFLEKVKAGCAKGLQDPKECVQLIRRLKDEIRLANEALTNCEAGLPSAGIQAAQGRVVFLRVHDEGGFGPNQDKLPGEVVFRFARSATIWRPPKPAML